MAALTEDIITEQMYLGNQYEISHPVAVASTIYRGAYVALDASAEAIAVTSTALSPVGIAVDHAEGADGDNVAVKWGMLAIVPFAAVAANLLAPLYASDDATLTLAAGAGTELGYIVKIVDAATVQIIVNLGR